MTVATTSHTSHRDMSGMDVRDVRLVQVIHGGISNWPLRPFARGRFVTWEGFRTRTEALLWSTCSKLLRRSQPLNLLTLEKGLAGSMGLNIDDFNQRTKVHEHLGNLVLEFLHQHHQSIKAHSPEDDTLQKYHNLKREYELLQAQYSASQRSSPPSTGVFGTGHTTSGESLTVFYSRQFLAHGECGCPQRQVLRCSTSATTSDHPISSCKQTAPKLLTMHSAPEDIIKHYTWTSEQPRVFLKQAPTTAAAPALIKWANYPSRLNGHKSLDAMAVQLQQARQRLAKGDAPTFASMASLWANQQKNMKTIVQKARQMQRKTAHKS